MSAVAGRVLLIPKGSYNSGITYNMLDVVKYEYDSYVAKTTTIGHDPTDTTYWQKMTDVGDDVDSLKETLTKNGAHNLLPLTLANLKALNTSGTWSENTYTHNGRTFAVQTDVNGSVTGITINGTNANTSNLIIRLYNPLAEDYILSGCPANGSSSTYRMWHGIRNADNTGWTTTSGTWSGTEATLSVQNNCPFIQCSIDIMANYTANNLVFKPMIRLASDTDSTFEPYAMTNRELTQAKLDVTQLKTVVAASSDFADFKTRIAAL